MRAAMIGDNCIDHYTEYVDRQGNVFHDRKYPTGNVVDTGVNLQKLGMKTSIISTTGSDENGQWMVNTLKGEGLDVSHLKVEQGPTAITYMTLNGNDRVHGDYIEGVLEHIVFDEEDIAFAAGHDLVHTALWGNAQDALPKIRSCSQAVISFDYADRLDHPLVESTLPYVDIGFYSYHKQRDEFIEGYLKDKVDRGMKVAVATFGELGSLAYDGRQFVQFGVVPAAEVVNTVGAGDSFIAGFLYQYMKGASLEACLKQGATVASNVVQVFEPWVTD